MTSNVQYETLMSFLSSLDNKEAAAAIRILLHMLSLKKPVPMRRARQIAQLSVNEWDACKDDILDHFTLRDDSLWHPELERELVDPASLPAHRKPNSRSLNLPLAAPTSAIPASPPPPLPGHTNAISIRKSAFLVLCEIFHRAGLSESAARTMLAALLRDWPPGDVYHAIEVTHKQQDIVDPRSWIIGVLRAKSREKKTGYGSQDSPKIDNVSSPSLELVNSETAGISSHTAEMIRRRNRKLAKKQERKAICA